jgi:sulfur carrier protein
LNDTRSPVIIAFPTPAPQCHAMQITFNGQPIDLPDAHSVQQLLEQQGLAQRRIAVEVNAEVVPRSRHATHALREGDRVEVVHALGGG